MFRLYDSKQKELTRLLAKGHSIWVVYLDIVKFHEIEFRHGIKACKRILDELTKEINLTLKPQKSFIKTILESRGGDDFVVYLVPGKNVPWTIGELPEKWVLPLVERLNQRITPWLGESIKLRQGIVLCKTKPGRNADYLLYEAVKEAFLLNKAEPDPQYFSRREEIRCLLQEPDTYLKSAFQPIVQIRTGSIFGFEALARLNRSSAFKNVGDLFPFAEKIGQLYPIETLCRRRAISSATRVLKNKETLFLNINPQVLSDPDFTSGQTRKLLQEQNLHPSNVVLEITEHSAIQDFAVFRHALNHYRSQGYRVALDDVGAGYSSLQSIAELHPDFLKIDRSLIGGVNADPIKWALLETFVTFSKRIGCHVIAEGVETAEELKTVVQLGVDFVQGFFIAKPEFRRAVLYEPAVELVQTVNTLKADLNLAIQSLIEPLPLFEATSKVNVLQTYFHDRPYEQLIGIVEQGKIVGTLPRDKLYATLGTRYGVSLFTDRPVSMLMDRNPLIVEDTTPIEVVSSLAMGRPYAQLYEGVVVVNRHRPVGMVSVASLMKAMADRQIQIGGMVAHEHHAG